MAKSLSQIRQGLKEVLGPDPKPFGLGPNKRSIREEDDDDAKAVPDEPVSAVMARMNARKTDQGKLDFLEKHVKSALNQSGLTDGRFAKHNEDLKNASAASKEATSSLREPIREEDEIDEAHRPVKPPIAGGKQGKLEARAGQQKAMGNQNRSPGTYAEEAMEKVKKKLGRTDTGRLAEPVNVEPNNQSLTGYH